MKVLSMVSMLVAVALALGAEYYCGRKLADTLETLCEQIDKRSGNELYAGWLGLYPGRGWLAAELLSSRGKRGVVDECCDKKCEVSELLTYCY